MHVRFVARRSEEQRDEKLRQVFGASESVQRDDVTCLVVLIIQMKMLMLAECSGVNVMKRVLVIERLQTTQEKRDTETAKASFETNASPPDKIATQDSNSQPPAKRKKLAQSSEQST